MAGISTFRVTAPTIAGMGRNERTSEQTSDRASRAPDTARQALRARILEAARRIVARDGLTALSMRKIADAIGYSPASLYLYFENRDAIAQALGDEGYAMLLAALELPADSSQSAAEPVIRLRALAQAYIAFAHAHPQTYRLVFVDLPGTHEQEAEPVVRVFADALAALGHPDEMRLAKAFWATLHGIATLAAARPAFSRTPLDQLVEAVLDVWLRASAGIERRHAVKATKTTAA
ncbi:TetR/AcrR family transcriptional regulator [Paraburkholderia acidipaludis]|uniref:TetR/AcrR family transcriptional regulator n=1 Tax=Paraburkholderia acidipaludis TaxID=660537 RepID=UPI0012EB4B56|nr:TetR/AcrR family transcriptional regulator [Paraburkholderia acidipaludis]